MKVSFVSPPLELQKGGIENAIEGLREALQGGGVIVSDGEFPLDKEVVHHFHGLWNPAHTRFAARLRRVGRPYVVSPHGMLEPWAFRNRWWKKLPYFHLVERRFLMGAASLFVTSLMECEHLRRVLPHPRVEVLPLGCRDPRQPHRGGARDRLGWPHHQRVMLYLSRVDPKKGMHLLLDALAGLPGLAREWRLVVVGDGPADYMDRLKKQQRVLDGLLPEIDWVGAVWGDDRWPYLKAADLFLLPTHSENFGIAVLEALHVGTPVLTTSGTPWRDWCDVQGIHICDPQVASIRKCLHGAVTEVSIAWSDSDRSNLARWAEARFSWPNLVNDYIAAYERAGS